MTISLATGLHLYTKERRATLDFQLNLFTDFHFLRELILYLLYTAVNARATQQTSIDTFGYVKRQEAQQQCKYI